MSVDGSTGNNTSPKKLTIEETRQILSDHSIPTKEAFKLIEYQLLQNDEELFYYVVETARLGCTRCKITLEIPCGPELKVVSQTFKHQNGLLMANEKDHTDGAIPPFLYCEAGGSCNPDVPEDWYHTKDDVTIVNGKALKYNDDYTKGSFCVCEKGKGIIYLKTHGQITQEEATRKQMIEEVKDLIEGINSLREEPFTREMSAEEIDRVATEWVDSKIGLNEALMKLPPGTDKIDITLLPSELQEKIMKLDGTCGNLAEFYNKVSNLSEYYFENEATSKHLISQDILDELVLGFGGAAKPHSVGLQAFYSVSAVALGLVGAQLGQAITGGFSLIKLGEEVYNGAKDLAKNAKDYVEQKFFEGDNQSSTIFNGGNLSVDEVKKNPKVFSGKSVEEIADMLRVEGYEVEVKASTKSRSGAQIIRILNPGGGKNISQVQVSPGGGRHGESPYIKISTTDSDIGIIKIIDGPESKYKSNAVENAIIIFSEK